MLLNAHQLAGGEAGNAHFFVLPWHGASHLPSSLKTRTIFMALIKQDGGAVRQKPVPNRSCLWDTWHMWRSCFFSFFSFPFLFSSVLFFFVILLPFFFFLPCFLVISMENPTECRVVTQRSSEMASAPPVLCCSTTRCFPRSFLSTVQGHCRDQQIEILNWAG